MRALRAVPIVLLALAAARPLAADFDDLGMGARALGMGDAFTGLADDNRAVYYNPAGLAWQRQAQLGADYSRLHMGLDDESEISLGFVSYAHPLFKFEPREAPKEETASVAESTAPASPDPGARVLMVEGKAVPLPPVPASPYRSAQPLVPQYGTFGAAVRQFELSGAYRENSYFLAYARTAARYFSWGATLKFLQEKYIQDAYTKVDPVFASDSGVSAVSGDLGVMWNYRARFFWGAALLDVNRPDVGIGTAERLPATYKTGFGYKDRRTSAAVDLTSRHGSKRVGGGMERWLGRGRTALRMGLDLGEGSQFNAACGFSFRVSVFQIDYGFRFPLTGVSDTAGTHRLSFLYRLGRPPKDEVEAGSLEASYYALQDEKTALEQKLKSVEQERDRLEDVLVEEATQHIRQRISRASGADGKRPAEAPVQTHLVRSGDTLMPLAYYYYKDSSRWKEIYEANRDKVGRGGRLKPGTLLVIPGKTVQAPPPPPAEPAAPRPAAPPAETVEVSTAAAPPVLVSLEKSRTAVPAKKISKPKAEPAPAQKFHTVKSGDTLESIARRYYGDEKRWVEIYKANRNKISRGAVDAGQVLLIP